jgi:hypothetical protein
VTGGLVFFDTAQIATRSEDLYISASRISVRYGLVNISTKDVSAPLSFPLPDLTGKVAEDSTPSIPDSVSPNFLDFTLEVDGASVKAVLEQKAFVGGVDQTAALRRLGVPVASYPGNEAVIAALDRLPAAAKQTLLRLRLVFAADEGNSPSDVDGAPLDVDHPWLRPAWDLKTTYVWRQQFHPGREVVVSLAYSPSVGLFPHPACCASGAKWTGPAAMAKERGRYCVGAGILAAVRRQPDPGDVEEAHFSEKYIDYALAEGPNGQAPIGDFRMVIDKGDEGDGANLASFCGGGVTRASDTRFEVRRTNFTPSRDVEVLFLIREPSLLEAP